MTFIEGLFSRTNAPNNPPSRETVKNQHRVLVEWVFIGLAGYKRPLTVEK
jgi:hypothetical protein